MNQIQAQLKSKPKSKVVLLLLLVLSPLIIWVLRRRVRELEEENWRLKWKIDELERKVEKLRSRSG
jgi:hypothetical protein